MGQRIFIFLFWIGFVFVFTGWFLFESTGVTVSCDGGEFRIGGLESVIKVLEHGRGLDSFCTTFRFSHLVCYGRSIFQTLIKIHSVI